MTVCALQATWKRSQLPPHVSFRPGGQSLSSTRTAIKRGQKSECQVEQRSLEKGCGNGKRDAHFTGRSEENQIMFKKEESKLEVKPSLC